MEWFDYLRALDTGLAVMERRLQGRFPNGRADRSVGAPVVYDPWAQVAAERQSLIGVGRHWGMEGDAPTALEHSGICLNDKGLQPSGETVSQSALGVTALALAADPERLEQWRSAVGDDALPERFFRRFTLVVEDASPDSCLGLIALLARINGVPPDALPGAWVRYAAQWEGGASRTTDPFRAWGPLLAALAHGYWDADLLRTDPARPKADGSPDSGLAIGQAWLACLRLTLALLQTSSPPDPIGELTICREAGRAQAFLHYEQQVCLQALEQAQRLQLLLPMEGPGRRFKVVDACVMEETALTGAKKVFLRNDREHAWLGDGFGLMALHRPAFAGSGDDMTVSVDPATGVHLRELWQALERAEDAAWTGERPNADPRQIVSYPGGLRPDTGDPSPDQPWWDGRGSYTLVAAPRRLRDGRLGTRLDWRENVLEILWECYRPDRMIEAIGDDGRLRSLATCRPEPLAGSDRRWLLLRCPTADRLPAGGPIGNSEPVLLTPTLQRCLAATVAVNPDSGGRLAPLARLPDADSFDFLEVEGGYALIHAAGLVVLDDWRSTELYEGAILAETRKVVERIKLLEETGAEANRLLAQLQDWISRGHWRRLGRMSTLDRLSEIRIRIREGLTTTASVTDDARIAAVRQSLERRWGIAAESQTIEHTLDEMEQILRSYAEVKSGRLINFLAVFGFSLALFAGFFSFVFDDMPRDWTGLLEWLNGDAAGTGPHWIALLAYAALSAAGMLLFLLGWRLARWLERLWHEGRG
jgi:hypothetical protein